MSPSAQLNLDQLKHIIQNERMSNHGAREAQEQVDVEDVLNPENTSSVVSTVLNTINNELNTTVLRRQSVWSLLMRFANHRMTMFQATSIQFEAYLELQLWRTKIGPSSSL
jgi:hypothetical protein